MSLDSLINNYSPNNDEIYYLSDDDCILLLNRVETIIDDVINECNYDKQNLKATHWSYILYQIGFRLFRIYPQIIHNINPVYYNNYKYRSDDLIPENIEIIYTLVYRPLCIKYNQIISIDGLCNILWILYDRVFYPKSKYNGKLSNKMLAIRQKLLTDRENTLRYVMESSNQNPVKYLAIGNHEFAWNVSGKEEVQEEAPVLSLDDIPDVPQLELSDNLALPDFGDDL